MCILFYTVFTLMNENITAYLYDKNRHSNCKTKNHLYSVACLSITIWIKKNPVCCCNFEREGGGGGNWVSSYHENWDQYKWRMQNTSTWYLYFMRFIKWLVNMVAHGPLVELHVLWKLCYLQSYKDLEGESVRETVVFGGLGNGQVSNKMN